MNKINIDGVLIVEGKDDVSYLSSFINVYFFITNGYDLSKEKIDFLNYASKRNKLIIFTDPDDAGNNIRKKLKENVSPIYEAKVKLVIRKNKKKTGIAEIEKEEIMSSLKEYISDKEINKNNYRLSSLISLSDNPKEKREKLIKKYHLVRGNNKLIEEQLNILKIDVAEIKGELDGN